MAGARPAGARQRAAALTLTLIPAAVLLYYVATTGVNGLVWDHLSSAELFDRWDTGNLTIEYLFRQHNEHRKAVPRLVVLGLGLLTDFNTRAELFLQAALLCATAVILFRAFRRDSFLEPLPAAVLAFAPAVWLMLSLRPYEILLVGDGLLTYLSMVFLAAALYLLAHGGPRSHLRFAAALSCGVLTSYSQANGLLVWPIGLLVLLSELRPRDRSRPVLSRAALWALAGAVTIAAYFHGYVDPGGPPARFALEHPVLAFKYFLCVTGGSLSPEQNSAMAGGIVVTALELLFGIAIARAWWRDRRQPPFGAWLMLLAVATNLMIALNRAPFGLGQALSSRYAAFSCFGPVGVYWCAVALRDRRPAARDLAAAMSMLLIVGSLAGSLDAWSRRHDWYAEKHWRAYVLYSAKYQPSSILESIYSDPAQARTFAGQLERLKLNVFAQPHVDPGQLAPAAEVPQFAVQTINGVPFETGRTIHIGPDDPVSIEGWALDDTGRGPAPAIFLTIDGALDIPGGARMRRVEPAVARSLRWSGFAGSFGGFALSPGEHTLALKIVSSDRAHVYRTPPLLVIVRR